MAIKIKIIDLPDDNIEIKEIRALPLEDLPTRYLIGYPNCGLVDKTLYIYYNDHTRILLNVNDIMLRSLFETYLGLICEAGDRLHRINNITNNKDTTYEI